VDGTKRTKAEARLTPSDDVLVAGEGTGVGATLDARCNGFLGGPLLCSCTTPERQRRRVSVNK